MLNHEVFYNGDTFRRTWTTEDERFYYEFDQYIRKVSETVDASNVFEAGVADETARATAVELSLADDLSQETLRSQAAVGTNLTNALSSEVSRATLAEGDLDDRADDLWINIPKSNITVQLGSVTPVVTSCWETPSAYYIDILGLTTGTVSSFKLLVTLPEAAPRVMVVQGLGFEISNYIPILFTASMSGSYISVTCLPNASLATNKQFCITFMILKGA